jgi:hypothetical protein
MMLTLKENVLKLGVIVYTGFIWVSARCNEVGEYQGLSDAYCLHLQGRMGIVFVRIGFGNYLFSTQKWSSMVNERWALFDWLNDSSQELCFVTSGVDLTVWWQYNGWYKRIPGQSALRSKFRMLSRLLNFIQQFQFWNKHRYAKASLAATVRCVWIFRPENKRRYDRRWWQTVPEFRVRVTSFDLSLSFLKVTVLVRASWRWIRSFCFWTSLAKPTLGNVLKGLLQSVGFLPSSTLSCRCNCSCISWDRKVIRV